MEKYLIIGNGTAAVSAIEGIRTLDPSGRITVISREEHPAYCRPLISYYLEGKASPARMSCRSESFYKDNSAEVIYSTAASLDPKAKKVKLESGTELEYTKLLIATGSSPFVPPMDGLETVPSKSFFMTLDDAYALERMTDENSRVLIVGAGLIGLKCAEGLAERVKKITVCDLAQKVMPSILDDDAAEMVKSRLEAAGIELMLGDTAAKFDGSKAVMRSGAEVEFDVLVIAVGVRPNISMFKDAGGECGRAITVDSHMRTSIPDIYAAGDCTESIDISCGGIKVMALMPNANIQGFCAGVNMAGGDKSFDNAVPMNSIGLFGCHVMSAGSYEGERRVIKTESCLKEFYIKDDLLKGFIIVDDTERAGIYTSLIRNKIPLGDVDFESLAKEPELFALGLDYCLPKLKGAV
jgi:NAD(P)H-nitrite reductase large subunit